MSISLSEATRQYQAVLEAVRSAPNDVQAHEAMQGELHWARREMESAWWDAWLRK